MNFQKKLNFFLKCVGMCMTYRSEKWQCLGFGGTSFSSCRHRHRRRLLFLFKLQSRNLKRESYYSSQCEPEFRLKNSSRLSSASAVIVVGVVFVIVAGLCCAKLFSPFSVIFMTNFKFISLCKSEWECEWMCKSVCVLPLPILTKFIHICTRF